MAGPWGNFILDKGFDADGAIRKVRAVKLVDQDTVTECDTSGEQILGVDQFGETTDEIARGKGASVRLMGVTEWEAGAAVDLDEEVMTDASGKCIPATGTGKFAAGRCISNPATVDGDVCSVLLYLGGRVL